MKKTTFHIISFLSGAVNAIFGSGAGILFVMTLKKEGLSQKSAQATALCATVFLSAISAAYYLYNGYFNISDALIYIPSGIPGALAGSYLLVKLPDKALKGIFSLFIILAGIRMVAR